MPPDPISFEDWSKELKDLNSSRPKPCHSKCKTCAKLRTPKPLAQYLSEYIEHELIDNNDSGTWRELLEQALYAYESTEGVVIQIIKKKEK